MSDINSEISNILKEFYISCFQQVLAGSNSHMQQSVICLITKTIFIIVKYNKNSLTVSNATVLTSISLLEYNNIGYPVNDVN